MKYINNNKSIFGIYLISPALSFIISINRMYKGDFSVCWIVPFVMATFAYLFPPYSDFARNLDLVYELKDMPVELVFLRNSDFVVPLIERFFVKNNIPIEFFRFIYTFVVYYWMNSIFLELYKKRCLSIRQGFYLWCLLFLTISFFAYIINLRTLFVNYSLLYSIYKIYYCGKNRYYLLAIFAGFVHFAYIPVVGILFLSRFVRYELSLSWKVVISILIIVLSSLAEMNFFLDVVSVLPLNDLIAKKIEIYTVGEWGANGDLTKHMHTTNYIIYTTLASFSLYYLYFVYLKNYCSNKYEGYITILLGLLLFTSPVTSLFTRYLAFLNSALLLHVIIAYSDGKIPGKYIRNLLCFQLFTTLLNVYANWNCLVNGNIIFLLLPVPLAIFQTYDFLEWCKLRLTDDFNDFINKSIFSRQ